MSDLENQAGKVLKQLLRDLEIPLDRADRRIIARWCLKTAMVLSTLEPGPEPPPFSPDEHKAVAADGAMPLLFYVWMGRHSVSDQLFHAGRRMRNPVPLDPSERRSLLAESYVTTLGLGGAIFQIVQFRFGDGAPHRYTVHRKPGPWQRASRRCAD
jgi:hypothetical protein